MRGGYERRQVYIKIEKLQRAEFGGFVLCFFFFSLCLFDSLRLNLGHSVWLLKNRVRFCNVLFLHSVRKQEQQRKRNVMKNNGQFYAHRH